MDAKAVAQGFRSSPGLPSLVVSCILTPDTHACTHTHARTHARAFCRRSVPPHADLAVPATSHGCELTAAGSGGPRRPVGRGSGLVLQSWRFSVVWLTPPDPGPSFKHISASWDNPRPGCRTPEFSVPGRGDREGPVSADWPVWGVWTGNMSCGGTGPGCGLRTWWLRFLLEK